MSRKRKKQDEGAPRWVMTYGDLMSLLLVFFVLIVSMSKIKEDERQRFFEEVLEAFGAKGGGGRLATTTDPALSELAILEELEVRRQQEVNQAQTTDPAIEGPVDAVRMVREGLRYIVGGRITFEPGSADLSNESLAQIAQAAEQIRGRNNIIELRGHAATHELADADGGFEDLWSLSHARARSVMEHLTSESVGIRRDRIRLVANADREPLVQRAYDTASNRLNRRVEIVQMEALVPEFTEPEATPR